jgi:predicted aspartyl protease
VPEYDVSFEPPAPYVSLQVSNPETSDKVLLRGKLDSGASISILPDTTIALLELVPQDDIWIAAFDGRISRYPTYFVTFEIEGYVLPDIEVTVSPRKDVLIGRDVLQHFILTLNGKEGKFDLVDP